MSSPPLRIGTSGWIYPHWRGVFYPPGLRPADWLGYYSAHFDTVEVNYSFYRLPSRAAFAAWRAATPPGFCFAVKGSRFVTHLKRLKDPERHVPRFFERAGALEEKLGPVLWQLPPQLARDDARLAAFLGALPRERRHALEFRHGSWLDPAVYDLLRAHGVALCIADAGGRSLPPEPVLTADWTYLRFHSGLADGAYTEEQLERWAGVVRALRAGGAAVYAYFNNDAHGYAVANARRLRALLAPA